MSLIRAVADGRATFLCGAGVSFRVNLPSFKVLTECVYSRLGESSSDEAAERNAIGRKEYDRALRSLEKRTYRPGTRSRLRDAVVDLLAPPAVPFPDHLALLQLSRDRDGRPRLLTTNFDTLFERAARDGGMPNVPSYAGVSMPRAGGERDFGILHLHGRIADDALGLERTDLIVTSADFGDAYLRSGWASRYIEDRMRLGTLVLVGYGAEDAAARNARRRSRSLPRST
jgi:NAD-dependent SIR2 family protein deacetylase